MRPDQISSDFSCVFGESARERGEKSGERGEKGGRERAQARASESVCERRENVLRASAYQVVSGVAARVVSVFLCISLFVYTYRYITHTHTHTHTHTDLSQSVFGTHTHSNLSHLSVLAYSNPRPKASSLLSLSPYQTEKGSVSRSKK